MTTFCMSLRGRNRPLYSKEILVPNDCPTRSSTWLTSFFLPCVSLGVGEQRFGQVVTKLLGILSSYHQHAISMFNTYSRVPSHRSLIDTDGGLQHWRCWLSTSLFPTDGPLLSPNGPVQSPVINLNMKPPK
jgi:hypothetical protein